MFVILIQYIVVLNAENESWSILKRLWVCFPSGVLFNCTSNNNGRWLSGTRELLISASLKFFIRMVCEIYGLLVSYDNPVISRFDLEPTQIS